MSAYSLADSGVLARLNGIPAVDVAANLQRHSRADAVPARWFGRLSGFGPGQGG